MSIKTVKVKINLGIYGNDLVVLRIWNEGIIVFIFLVLFQDGVYFLKNTRGGDSVNGKLCA